jgi:hypothetical protein
VTEGSTPSANVRDAGAFSLPPRPRAVAHKEARHVLATALAEHSMGTLGAAWRRHLAFERHGAIPSVAGSPAPYLQQTSPLPISRSHRPKTETRVAEGTCATIFQSRVVLGVSVCLDLRPST